MTEIRYWIADDGTKFDDEFDCGQYEKMQKLREYREDIAFYNYRLEPIPLESAEPQLINIIRVKSIMAADCIYEWFELEGYNSPFESFNLETSVGTWVYGELIDEGDEWIKLEDKIASLQNLLEKIKGIGGE